MHNSKHARYHHRFTEHPAFPARWFYGLFRALPGDRACLPPSSPRSLLLENLTPASGRQDHTTSPSARNVIRLLTCRVHRIPPNVRDDRETPLMWAGMTKTQVIWLGGNQKFLQRGWTDGSCDCPWAAPSVVHVI